MAAPDIFVNLGWEHGGAFKDAAVTGTTASSRNVEGTIVQEQFGRRGYQHSYVDDSGMSQPAYTLQNAASPTTIGVLRIYFAIPALPGRNQVIVGYFSGTSSSATYFVLRILTSGYVEAGYGTLGGGNNPQTSSLTGSVTSTLQACPGRWHRLDLRVDGGGGASVADWYLNGVAQPQSTRASGSNYLTVRVGNHPTHANPSTTLYTDDLAVSTDSASFPIGPGESYLLKVGGWDPGDLRQNLFYGPPTTSMFYFQDGTAIDLLTDPADIVDALANGIMEDGVTIAAANNGQAIEMHAPFGNGTVSYAPAMIWTFEQLAALKSGQEIACVIGWQEQYASSPQPGRTEVINIYPPSGAGTVITQKRLGNTDGTVKGEGLNNGGSFFIEKFSTPSGGWDLTKLNGLEAWWTYDAISASASTGYHGIHFLAIEVHLTSSEEFEKVGCNRESWGMIAA